MGYVSINELRRVATELLKNSGVPDEENTIITDSIEFAHRRGKHTHGIGRVPIYLKKIDKGLMSAKTGEKIVKESSVIDVIDANHGFGQVSACHAIEKATEKAAVYGVGIVGVKNSNNFATAGFISEMALKKNMIGIVMSNSAPAIAPTGGKKPLFGTNPLSIAFPGTPDNYPIVMDMAMSVAARGKIRLADKNGEKIPFGWALDPEGNATDDPSLAIKGTMIPIGDHKGYGLSLAIDILAGLLTGSGFAGDVKPLGFMDGYSGYGHLVIAINPEFFLTKEEYCEKINYLIKQVKATGKDDMIYLPGEISQKKADTQGDTVSISDKQIVEINSLCDSKMIKPLSIIQ